MLWNLEYSALISRFCNDTQHVGKGTRSLTYLSRDSWDITVAAEDRDTQPESPARKELKTSHFAWSSIL